MKCSKWLQCNSSNINSLSKDTMDIDICSRPFGSKELTSTISRLDTGGLEMCKNNSYRKVSNEHEQYICDICKKAFTARKYFLRHFAIHSEVRKYQCNICNVAFKQYSSLYNHKLSHSGLKKYQCNICNVAFKQYSCLYNHKLSHSELKKYQCDICNKFFTRAGGLSKHKLFHCDRITDVTYVTDLFVVGVPCQPIT